MIMDMIKQSEQLSGSALTYENDAKILKSKNRQPVFDFEEARKLFTGVHEY